MATNSSVPNALVSASNANNTPNSSSDLNTTSEAVLTLLSVKEDLSNEPISNMATPKRKGSMDNTTGLKDGDEESKTVNNSALALPFRASFEAGATFQVSAELFGQLLMSVDGMKKEMALVQNQLKTFENLTKEMAQVQQELVVVKSQNQELQTKLIHLGSDVHALAENTGATFSHFMKLPLELRTEIWQIALRVPQVIGLVAIEVPAEGPYSQDRNVQFMTFLKSRPLNSIRKTCRAARKEALAVQTASYPRYPLDRGGMHTQGSDIPIFSNPSSDILWFRDAGRHEREWIGGPLLKIAHGLSAHTIKPRIIAFPFDYFGELDESELCNVMEAFQKCEVEEIILVVGDNEARWDGLDVIFIDPTNPIIERDWYAYQDRGIWQEFRELIQKSPNPSWNLAEWHWNRTLQDIKSRHAIARAKLLADGHSKMELLENRDTEEGVLGWDCSKWTVKEIHIREAIVKTEFEQKKLLPSWNECMVIPRQ